MVLDWPHSFGSIREDLVPEVLLKQMRQESGTVAQCPNFWTAASWMRDPARPCTAFEAAIAGLYTAVQPSLSSPCAGAEWWVQVYEQGKGLPFHFDKDESLFKEQQAMVHPMLSSVLYLTGASAAPKRLGPTVIVDQQYDNRLGCPQPDTPQRSLLIYPRRGQFAVFDGCLGHGVLGSSSREQRVTLLVNWWSHKPQGVDVISGSHITEHSIKVGRWDIASKQLAGDLPEAGESGGEVNPPAERSLGSAAVESHRAEPAACQHIPVLTLPPADADSTAVTVDDLIESCGHCILGKPACHGVAIEHEGYALWPLADDDNDGQTQDMLTAAVLVPLHMIPCDDSSSSDGG